MATTLKIYPKFQKIISILKSPSDSYKLYSTSVSRINGCLKMTCL